MGRRRGHSTNPRLIRQRLYRLKRKMNVSWRELAYTFGTTQRSVQRWAAAKHAPRLVYQRTLLSLEINHKLRERSIWVAGPTPAPGFEP